MNEYQRFMFNVPVEAQDFKEYLQVSLATAQAWLRNPPKIDAEGREEDSYDSEAYLKSQLPAADKALCDAANKGNSNALRILAQRLGLLIEKQEIRVGRTADEIARSMLDAERVLSERRDRVVDVQEESPALHDKPRLDSGQNSAEDN